MKGVGRVQMISWNDTAPEMGWCNNLNFPWYCVGKSGTQEMKWKEHGTTLREQMYPPDPHHHPMQA